jgi:dimethylaniline monooxygenase (N-oxide forming)
MLETVPRDDGNTAAAAESARSDAADIAIIGAGSSGITVAKALKARGMRADIFEKGSNIGGMWRYENDSGLSSAYASLHIDTSRDNLGYSDFPIPRHLPDFLSHREFLAYLEAYADHFGVRDRIRFKTEVKQLAPDAGGTWAVRLADGSARKYRHVVVANGHLWNPKYPDFPGTFSGEAIHSHHYRTAAPFEGKSVLVVGLGNSAVDIAVDLARRATRVTISSRRSAWIMPKYLMGRPTDHWSRFFSRKLHLPTPLTRQIMAQVIKLGVGDQSRFGLRKPDHPMWREHATLSQDLLSYMGHGWISVKPNIRTLDGDTVVFEDDSRASFDAIIYATGYQTSFPFFDNTLFDPVAEVGRLYRRIVPLNRRGLYFAGLVQPVGPTIPLVEIQGEWLAAALSGAMRLPDARTMEREVDKHLAYQRRTYLDADRYRLEVDFKTYARQMRGDMRRSMVGA